MGNSPRSARVMLARYRGGGGRGVVLVDRILAGLGRPRPLWIALWTALALLRVPLLLLGVRLDGSVPPDDMEILTRVVSGGVTSLVVLLSLWGAGRLARGLEAAVETTRRATGREPGAVLSPMRAVSFRAAPLVMAGLLTLVEGIPDARQFGLLAGLVELPLQAAVCVPPMTLLWVYLALLLGLHRLGGDDLAGATFPQERSLGLRPVGDLALTAFWIFAAAIVPVLVFTTRTIGDVLLHLGILVAGVAALLVSMGRLHRRMREAKAAIVVHARALYARAYAPVRASVDAAALRRQAPSLAAAEALLHRAESLHVWPFDTGLLARGAVIVTSVIAAITAKVVATSIGL
jgi:hypothetical protein